jgi:hypothetical protein
MPQIRLMQTETRAGALPVACLICGGPVAGHVRKLFVWRPNWLYLLAVLNWLTLPILPISIMLFIIRIFNVRRMVVECPMCARHSSYFAWRGFLIYAPFTVLTVAALAQVFFIVAGALRGPQFGFLLLVTALLLLGCGTIGWVVRRLGVGAIEITDEWIVLNNVHPVFAEQLRLSRLEMRQARRDFGWEEYDPYPRAALGEAGNDAHLGANSSRARR